ncbi:hypothetical protein EVAR_44002_1 [Eumeta japonica]|uniref:Uncharacterized protein n=1 Tax=Eumeta variegata TaxID=151549 RepID=A0A4C1XCA7_EUMVA|nr:hypothetical protein EVAR_44002_1 [Eumeta japonica]
MKTKKGLRFKTHMDSQIWLMRVLLLNLSYSYDFVLEVFVKQGPVGAARVTLTRLLYGSIRVCGTRNGKKIKLCRTVGVCPKADSKRSPRPPPALLPAHPNRLIPCAFINKSEFV